MNPAFPKEQNERIERALDGLLSPTELTAFQADSFTTGASQTLSGTVTQSASAATVNLQGTSGGAVIDTATFRLTGSLGYADV